jgi:uncharacterized RDD family membrane protein YckC
MFDQSSPNNGDDYQPDGKHTAGSDAPGGEGSRLWHLLQDDGTQDQPADSGVPEKSPEETTPPGEPELPVPGENLEDLEKDEWERYQGAPPESDEERAAQISRIERILSDPDAVEKYDVRTVDDADDYDDAVRDYYRGAGQTIMCAHFPDRAAVAQCPECARYFSEEWLVVRKGRVICRDCSDSLYVPSEEEIFRAQELGEDVQTAGIEEDEKPEFQVGSTAFGIEGRPASPLKRILALLLDLLVIRGLAVILLWLLGVFFGNIDSPVFQLFDTVEGESTFRRVTDALILFRPVLPWLMVLAIVDFTYFFLTLSFANRTPGMSWVSCRLVTEWGDYVSFGAVALRTMIFMVCLGLPAILIGVFFPGYRGPHDYASGTMVINYSGNKRVDAYDSIQIKMH